MKTLKKCKGHENIVKVLGFGTFAPTGRPLIVLELCQLNLNKLCKIRQLRMAEKAYILREISRAVSHMHEHEMVHRQDIYTWLRRDPNLFKYDS